MRTHDIETEDDVLGAWDIQDGIYCDTCHGTGVVDCWCGGDLCVCGARGPGELPCPDC